MAQAHVRVAHYDTRTQIETQLFGKSDQDLDPADLELVRKTRAQLRALLEQKRQAALAQQAQK